MTRAPILAAIVVLASCSASSEDATTPPAPVPAVAQPAPLADTLVLEDLAIYQGVKVGLVEEAKTLKPTTPVVPNRPALVRVGLRAPIKEDVKGRFFLAELAIHRPMEADVILADSARRIVPREEMSLYTTFNFELDASLVTAGMTLDVTVRDAARPGADVVRFPAEPFAVKVGSLAPVLKVRLLPIKYDFDGSGRVPDLGELPLENLRRSLYKLMPVSSVDISVAEPIPWAQRVNPDGSGWEGILDTAINARASDVPADDVYYAAVVNPKASQGEFCVEGGCVLGLAPQASLGDVGLRVAMVLGYSSAWEDATLAHELSHAMGRGHAPCGVRAGVDGQFPHFEAQIGVTGYDVLEKQLFDAEGRARDFMGYCHPVWVSDYTYSALYTRMLGVNTTKRPNARASSESRAPSSVTDRNGVRRPGPWIDVLPGVTRGPRNLDDIGGTITIE